jgi:hypothetical protein
MLISNVYGSRIRYPSVMNDELSKFLGCAQSSGFPKKGVCLMNAADIRRVIRVMRAVHVDEQFKSPPSHGMLYNFMNEHVHCWLTVPVAPRTS